MNITKLTITPLVSKAQNMEFHQPEAERAAHLIKERLNCAPYDHFTSFKEVRRRLPKELRGFVNPETWVPNSTK